MSNPSSLPTKRFQFSLRWLLIAVTLVALLLGLSTIFGGGLVNVAAYILYVVFAVPLVVTIIFARGDLQTFAIGGVVPWSTITVSRIPSGGIVGLEIIVWLLVLTGISGFVAIATRRWIESHGHGG
jgi:hypothetical protein